MKLKIDFKKLVWGYYSPFNLDIELEMVNWFFKTGLEGGGYQEQHGWYKSGINQLLYGYSGNDETNYYAPFPLIGNHLKRYIMAIFVRGILAPYSHDGFPTKINEWREKNKIYIDKYRFFNFPDRSANDIHHLLWSIGHYEGKELKKRFFHPDFPNRTHPRIITVTFSTYGTGYFVSIGFSFWEFNYEPGWSMAIAQQRPGEYLGDFLARAETKLKFFTVNTETDKRTLFEEKNSFIRFSERGCFNCIWYNHHSPHACGCMELDGIKNCSITNPKNHLCDEWEYNYNLIGKFPNERIIKDSK